MMSWNVNGFRAALRKEEGFEEFFKEFDFEVLCLQETKLSEGKIPKKWKKRDKYHTYWNLADKKGYSGVGVYSKIEPQSVDFDMGKEKHDKEGRMITLEYEPFYLVNVYTPNSQRGLKRLDYREEWEDDFRNFVNDLRDDKPVVICGDLNVAHREKDLANPKSNYNKTAGYTQREIDKFEELLDSGFIDTFREFEEGGGHYTWWSYRFNARKKNVGWRLDYFLISEELKDNLKDASIHSDIMGSDHCPVSCKLEFEE